MNWLRQISMRGASCMASTHAQHKGPREPVVGFSRHPHSCLHLWGFVARATLSTLSRCAASGLGIRTALGRVGLRGGAGKPF